MDWALIMAGGKGTRFWPVSRAKKPKQLLAIVSEQSLLDETVERARELVAYERMLVVTTAEQAAAIRKALPRVPKANILVEPVGRNTAACIGWGVERIADKDPEGAVMVLPADHHIPEKELFAQTVRQALFVARSKEAPVTLGIRPTCPSTGYGYLRRGSAVKTVPGVFHLKSFEEKPSFERARDYVNRGYLWNSGMFIWTVPVIRSAFKKYLPAHARLLEKIRRSPKSLARLYPRFESISVDYGIMEKMRHAYVVEALFRWSDIGSWEALRDFWPADDRENVSRGELAVIDSHDNLIETTPRKLTALLGVKNLAVIDTPDALLVADRHRLQEVREIVELLAKKGKKAVL